MIRHINWRLFLFLTAAFIVTIIAGTILHELGHYLVARLMGLDAYISYASTWASAPNEPTSVTQSFWFTIAGPLQTLFTGTIGFFLLCRANVSPARLSLKHWFFIFLSLFWLRQSVNFIFWVGGFFRYGYFTNTGDEIKLSQYWGLHPLIITSFTAVIGLAILAVIFFKFIPKSQRLTFLLSGITGGAFGFIIWFVFLGKLIMP